MIGPYLQTPIHPDLIRTMGPLPSCRQSLQRCFTRRHMLDMSLAKQHFALLRSMQTISVSVLVPSPSLLAFLRAC